jgi:hypothetical protein
MATDKKLTYEDQRLTKDQQKKIKPANQGGGPNYLGKQKTVTVPKKWLSSPDHVVAELAYITPREQKILLDANIYGSLKGKPNKGPGGIMSLQGDLGGYDASPGGPDSGGPGGNRVGEGDAGKQRASDIMTGKVNVTSPTGITEGYTGPEGVPEYAYGPDGKPKYIGSAQKYVGPSLFNPSGYRDIYNTTGGIFGFGGRPDITLVGAPGRQRYEFTDPRTGNVKPGFGGRLLGGIASLVAGVPILGSALGTMYDYGTGFFKGNTPNYSDMSDFNRLTIGGVDPVLADNYSELKIAEQGESPPVAMEPVFDQDFNYGIDTINFNDATSDDGYTIAELNEAIEKSVPKTYNRGIGLGAYDGS